MPNLHQPSCSGHRGWSEVTFQLVCVMPIQCAYIVMSQTMAMFVLCLYDVHTWPNITNMLDYGIVFCSTHIQYQTNKSHICTLIWNITLLLYTITQVCIKHYAWIQYIHYHMGLYQTLYKDTVYTLSHGSVSNIPGYSIYTITWVCIKHYAWIQYIHYHMGLYQTLHGYSIYTITLVCIKHYVWIQYIQYHMGLYQTLYRECIHYCMGLYQTYRDMVNILINQVRSYIFKINFVKGNLYMFLLC